MEPFHTFNIVKHTAESRNSHADDSYLPLRANSMDLIAVVLLVPVVTLNDATNSWVFVFKTRICNNAQKIYSYVR